MNYGTNHFKNMRAAQIYYAKQRIGVTEVRDKIENGEIRLGKPTPIVEGDKVFLDRDGRYWMENHG